MIEKHQDAAKAGGFCIHGNTPSACRRCEEDAEKRDAAKNKELSEIERFRDARLEFLISEHAEYLNEGNNGAVFKIRLDSLPNDLKEDLKGMGLSDDQEGESVIKILKVYSAGQGKREFELQKKAFDIASMKKDDPRYAQVPEPRICRDLEISQETASKLRRSSSGFKASNRVEVIVMDFVPGQDTATMLYRELIKRNKKTVHLTGALEPTTFGDLEHDVFQAVGHSEAGGKSRDEGARIHEQQKIEWENKEKVLKFLREETDLWIDPIVVEQMENTIRLFHENGLTIRDGHQRNFMVTGDYEFRKDRSPEQMPKTYVIDFGNAIEIDKGLSETEIKERYIKAADTEGRNYLDPYVPARDLKTLTTPPQERRKKRGGSDDFRMKLKTMRLDREKRWEKRPNEAMTKYEQKLEMILLSKEPISHVDVGYVLKRNPLGQDISERIENILIAIERVIARSPSAAERVRPLLEKVSADVTPAEKVKIGTYLA